MRSLIGLLFLSLVPATLFVSGLSLGLQLGGALEREHQARAHEPLLDLVGVELVDCLKMNAELEGTSWRALLMADDALDAAQTFEKLYDDERATRCEAPAMWSFGPTTITTPVPDAPLNVIPYPSYGPPLVWDDLVLTPNGSAP